MHKEGCKLKWKRPLDDGGTPIEYYQVEKYDSAKGAWVPCGKTTDPSKIIQLYFHKTLFLFDF